MTDVWIVVVEDSHADVGVFPFSSEELAAGYAREQAGANAHGECEVTEDEIPAREAREGLVLSLTYCVEGDCVRVIRGTVDAGAASPG